MIEKRPDCRTHQLGDLSVQLGQMYPEGPKPVVHSPGQMRTMRAEKAPTDYPTFSSVTIESRYIPSDLSPSIALDQAPFFVSQHDAARIDTWTEKDSPSHERLHTHLVIFPHFDDTIHSLRRMMRIMDTQEREAAERILIQTIPKCYYAEEEGFSFAINGKPYVRITTSTSKEPYHLSHSSAVTSELYDDGAMLLIMQTGSMQLPRNLRGQPQTTHLISGIHFKSVDPERIFQQLSSFTHQQDPNIQDIYAVAQPFLMAQFVS